MVGTRYFTSVKNNVINNIKKELAKKLLRKIVYVNKTKLCKLHKS